MPHILAIDIGTSRVKAALIDAEGKLCGLESKSVSRSDSPDTQSAEEWYALAAECVRLLLTKIPSSPMPFPSPEICTPCYVLMPRAIPWPPQNYGVPIPQLQNRMNSMSGSGKKFSPGQGTLSRRCLLCRNCSA